MSIFDNPVDIFADNVQQLPDDPESLVAAVYLEPRGIWHIVSSLDGPITLEAWAACPPCNGVNPPRNNRLWDKGIVFDFLRRNGVETSDPGIMATIRDICMRHGVRVKRYTVKGSPVISLHMDPAMMDRGCWCRHMFECEADLCRRV